MINTAIDPWSLPSDDSFVYKTVLDDVGASVGPGVTSRIDEGMVVIEGAPDGVILGEDVIGAFGYGVGERVGWSVGNNDGLVEDWEGFLVMVGEPVVGEVDGALVMREMVGLIVG